MNISLDPSSLNYLDTRRNIQCWTEMIRPFRQYLSSMTRKEEFLIQCWKKVVLSFYCWLYILCKNPDKGCNSRINVWYSTRSRTTELMTPKLMSSRLEPALHDSFSVCSSHLATKNKAWISSESGKWSSCFFEWNGTDRSGIW